MPKIIDETGKQYNNFIVLYKNIELTKQKSRAYWTCECQKCKTKKDISGTNLRAKNFICNTCQEEEKHSEKIGKQYGDLTVIDFDSVDKDRHYIWKCKCKCGNIESIKGSDLNSGIRIRCKECGKNNRTPQPNFIDETGNKYGLLTVLKRDPTKTKNGFWICRCECGNIVSIWGNHLRKNHTQSCGCTRMSHGEIKIKQILEKNNILFEQEYPAFNFEKTNRPARFDFYVNNNYFIEFDGETHYQTNLGGWHSQEQVKEQQERDTIKNNWCKENNIPLIRIPYTHLDSLCLEDLLLESSNFII